MTPRGLGRRAAAACVAGTAALAGTALWAPPAAAAAEPHYTPRLSFTAYTDSATPDETTYWPDTSMPVGTIVDEGGTAHTHRAYIGFEIGGINQARLSSARLSGYEYTVPDCSVTRALNVRSIEPFDGHTWAGPPATLGATVPLSATGDGCESGLTGDLTTALDRALARDQGTLWLEIRVPQRRETDPRYGRHVSTEWRLEVDLLNRAPDKPLELRVGNNDDPCTDDYASSQDFSVLAKLTDPDRDPGDRLTAEFEYWNTGTPGQRVTKSDEYPSSDQWASTLIPVRELPDGRYGWRARAFDQRAHSPWSEACYFTVDKTAPDAVPTVASPEYPEDSRVPTGERGQRGTFLFTANGVADVVAFEYGVDRWSMTRVAADRPGGAATARYAPSGSGVQTLLVRSIDRAGNRSADRPYRFNVRDFAITPVTIGQTPDPSGAPGYAVTVEFRTQAQNGIATVRYRVDGGAEQTTAIGLNGMGRAVLTPLSAGQHIVEYDGLDAEGKVLTRWTGTAYLYVVERP